MSVVVAFSGRIASGKSTISRGLAALRGWQRVSFGDYVRTLATERGLDATDIRVLQDLGEDLVQNQPDEFIRAVLQTADWQPGQPLVVDGLRHTEIGSRLRSMVVPSTLVRVHIATEFDIREYRLRSRNLSALRTLQELETHPTEKQSSVQLGVEAEMLVDGAVDETAIIQSISEWLDQHQAELRPRNL